jgi:hypothetical protein
MAFLYKNSQALRKPKVYYVLGKPIIRAYPEPVNSSPLDILRSPEFSGQCPLDDKGNQLPFVSKA